MRIAKVIDRKRREIFAEVVMVGRVFFDDRPGWVLLSMPLNKPARKRDLQWMHPAEVWFVWVRVLNFASQ